MKILKLLILVVACIGCSNSQAGKSVDLSQGLPLPAIPDTLLTPQERASYLVGHFWDDMDFNNSVYALDTVFMESAFANFASVLPVATTGESLQTTIGDLFLKASSNEQAYKLLGEISEKYLFEIESPVFNEDMYLYFVNAQLSGDKISNATRARLEYQKECLSLNPKGCQANDFEFLTRDGKKHKLSEYPAQATKTLLIFFDPDCDDCHQLMNHLEEDYWINNAIEHQWLNILAIANFETQERWNDTKDSLPSNWIVGYDITDIQGNDLYFLPNTPTLIVLDRNGNVVIKNQLPQPTIEALMQ